MVNETTYCIIEHLHTLPAHNNKRSSSQRMRHAAFMLLSSRQEISQWSIKLGHVNSPVKLFQKSCNRSVDGK